MKTLLLTDIQAAGVVNEILAGRSVGYIKNADGTETQWMFITKEYDAKKFTRPNHDYERGLENK